MDAVLELSNPEVFNLEDEITKTTELIRKLSEAEESLAQHQAILEKENWRMVSEIYDNKHRTLTEWIRDVREEICLLEEFPIKKSNYLGDTITAKELVEPIQRSRAKFRHQNKNLATERMMGRKLQEHERERQKQLEVLQATKANMQSNSWPMNRYRRSEPFPQKSVKGIMKIWVEKSEHLSSLVLRDSKNLDPTRETSKYFHELREAQKQLPYMDKAAFANHWNSMRQTRHSFARMKFELMKESRRHREGYAEYKRVEEKRSELREHLNEGYTELRKMRQQIRAANNSFLKLQKKQNDREVATSVP